MSTPSSLDGVTVAVTRPAHQAAALADVFTQRGARVVVVPLVEIDVDASGVAELGRLLANEAPRVDVVVVTSPNGARCLARVWPHHLEHRPSVVVVGPGTAAALETAGGPHASLVAADHLGEGVVTAIGGPPGGHGTGRVVVAQGDLARPVVVEGLRAAGWQVTAVTVYRTLARVVSSGEREQLLEADVVTLTSGSAARSWAEARGDRPGPLVVVMGPVTEDVARHCGLDVADVARPHTLDGLVEATIRAVSQRRRGAYESGS
jgi:uroporphyrinogen-III synthase